MDKIVDLLNQRGVDKSFVGYLAFGILLFIIFIICVLVNFILKKIVLKILAGIILHNKYKWDNKLLEHKVFYHIANIAPAIIIYAFAPSFPYYTDIIKRGATIYFLIAFIFIFNALIDSLNDIYLDYEISKVRPIKGFLQVVKIVFYIIIAIVFIASLMGESPIILLSGIGAFAAVFSFVFKDSILGFIAGIQLTSNDMLRIGDWIEMSKYGADGDVIDITLNTVKVQNFDKTIVSIPAYALVSDSFKNWRGVMEFGGRRIKRSIYIDVNSISFCSPEMIEKFKKIRYLKDYVTEKEAELKEYNKIHSKDSNLLINGRHMTNIGTFRIYITKYLNHHPELHKEMPIMVRQLPPAENGLPVEIYAFTNDINWENYERVQADIFDHIFSVAEEFGLRVFQNPTGYDVKQINTSGKLL